MPDAKTARISVVWAMVIIGSFYIMTTFLGFGAATIVGRDLHRQRTAAINMSAPLLAQALAGDIFFAFISAIAFATILAVVAGLTISASTSFAHDFYTERDPPRHGAEPGRRGARGADHGVRRRRGLDRRRDPAGPTVNVAFLVGAGLRGGGLGQPAGDPAVDFLEALQHRGRGLRPRHGTGRSLVLIGISPSIMGIDPPTVAAAART